MQYAGGPKPAYSSTQVIYETASNQQDETKDAYRSLHGNVIVVVVFCLIPSGLFASKSRHRGPRSMMPLPRGPETLAFFSNLSFVQYKLVLMLFVRKKENATLTYKQDKDENSPGRAMDCLFAGYEIFDNMETRYLGTLVCMVCIQLYAYNFVPVLFRSSTIVHG